MTKASSEVSETCEENHSRAECSPLQVFANNLPYAMMIVLGAIILFAGHLGPQWRWIAGVLYVVYGAAGAFWIMAFLCPYCGYYGSKSCPCGYGKVAAKFRPKGDSARFREKFKTHIPVIVPLWLIPAVAGVIFLILAFSWLMLALVVIFAINSFIILPLASRRHGCGDCPQRDDCPWMTHGHSET